MNRFSAQMNQINWQRNGVDSRTRMFIYTICRSGYSAPPAPRIQAAASGILLAALNTRSSPPAMPAPRLTDTGQAGQGLEDCRREEDTFQKTSDRAEVFRSKDPGLRQETRCHGQLRYLSIQLA